MVYVREAHAADGWQMGGWDNGVKDPKTLAERQKVGARCKSELKFKFPALADHMDDRVAVRWAAWPERLFVVSKAGKVVYAGGQGPWGFIPVERTRGRKTRSGGSLMSFLDGYKLKKAAPKKSTGEKTEFH